MRTVVAYLAVPAIRRGALVLLAALAALCVVQVEWRGPLAQEYAVADRKFKSLKSEVSQLNARIESVDTFDAMESRLAKASARLRSGVDRSGVVERLTALSASAGTRIIHGSNSFGRPRGDVIPVEQDLTVEGPYSALARFLAGLEDVETLTLLRSVEMAANPDGTLVRAKIKLVTLSQEADG